MAKIVHISDLHISEHILRGPSRDAYLPHRYGHDVAAFLALDSFLKNSDWDLLLVTGDVSRIGNVSSFEWARNWLENEIVFGQTRIGLNLSKSDSKHYVMVPGNHDRFNGKLTQSSLDNYHKEFQPVQSGAVERFKLGDFVVNVHLFDSTWEKGGFAFGQIDQRSLVAKKLSDEEIDLAVLHHHFLRPPKHPREIKTELINSTEVAAYMLNSGFDGIFFGHTHKGYIGRPSVEVLSGLLNDRRKVARFAKSKFPKIYLHLDRLLSKDKGLIAYERESTQNGQLPTLESYFNYLYLRQKGFNLRGPSKFRDIKEFYEQMKLIPSDRSMEKELVRIKKKMILVSLAPSACQAEATWNGFHVIEIGKDGDSKTAFNWDRYEFTKGAFVMKAQDEHVS